MNSRFEKWKKQLHDPCTDPKDRENTLTELHKSFAFLSQEEQRFANLFLHDMQTGDVKLSPGKTFRDYIVMYARNEKEEQVKRVVKYLGVSESLLTDMMHAHVSKEKLNEYRRFDALKESVVREKAQDYFTKVDGEKLPPFLVKNRVEQLLTDFVLSDGCDIPDPDNEK